jgi:hypothetical protein
LLYASKPQRENLCLLAFGLFAVGSAQLTHIAARLPLCINVASAVQRLERLVKNPHIDTDLAYAPLARMVLSRFAGGKVRLILDATQINGRVHLLFAAAAYRGRALPIAWNAIQMKNGTSSFPEQVRLLDRVAALIPPNAQVILLGDREYGTVNLMNYCFEHNWRFCLRIKGARALSDRNGQTKTACASAKAAGLAPGGRCFLSYLSLPKLPGRTVNLACGWSQEGRDYDPWFLLTDLPADPYVLSLYRVRFHIEEMFRDFKEFGFRLEQTRIKMAERISRLLVGICIAYVWLLGTGVWLCKNGRRKRVDRRPKRQLSHFRIGLRYLQQSLLRNMPIPLKLAIYT